MVGSSMAVALKGQQRLQQRTQRRPSWNRRCQITEEATDSRVQELLKAGGLPEGTKVELMTDSRREGVAGKDKLVSSWRYL